MCNTVNVFLTPFYATQLAFPFLHLRFQQITIKDRFLYNRENLIPFNVPLALNLFLWDPIILRDRLKGLLMHQKQVERFIFTYHSPPLSIYLFLTIILLPSLSIFIYHSHLLFHFWNFSLSINHFNYIPLFLLIFLSIYLSFSLFIFLYLSLLYFFSFLSISLSLYLSF